MIAFLQGLPASFRSFIYGAYAVVLFALGGIQVGYATNNGEQPSWLTIALNVMAYIGIAIGVTASANAPSAKANVPGEGGYFDALMMLLVAVAALGALIMISGLMTGNPLTFIVGAVAVLTCARLVAARVRPLLRE